MENPENFIGLLCDAGLEDVDVYLFGMDKLISLDNVVLGEFEKREIMDEWKNRPEEPFIFW